jgi:hypothetical protein
VFRTTIKKYANTTYGFLIYCGCEIYFSSKYIYWIGEIVTVKLACQGRDLITIKKYANTTYGFLIYSGCEIYFSSKYIYWIGEIVIVKLACQGRDLIQARKKRFQVSLTRRVVLIKKCILAKCNPREYTD